MACTIAAPSKLHVVIAPSGPGALTIGSVLNRPRRSGTDWWSAAATASEERGYTGHEHLDDVTLIHMNGRAYDPQLARFTSPDPFVPAPLYSQSYNRYAYVYGNPLNFTDPSGFVPRDECSRFPIDCGNTGPSFWPRLTLPYVPDDGFDRVDPSDWELYFQMQAIQDAQQQGHPRPRRLRLIRRSRQTSKALNRSSPSSPAPRLRWRRLAPWLRIS